MKSVRVRFAPSPTGLLHLGSVRIALFNYLFARQQQGTFIVRIEDTDPERNFDPRAQIILEDLAWLQLSFDEGPGVGGPYKPYFQSERTEIYRQKLELLKQKNTVYQCFCTEDELEKRRMRQIALKQAPRYDRTCLQLSETEINKKISDNIPFIWRFKLDTSKTVHVNDLARGSIEFHLSNFSDFALTRQTGTFTFLFANAVDDIVMHVSHIFRGEDHISNTPCQVALYEAFGASIPIFWHMPIICNVDGKKLSKRDFGFSLRDLKAAGFLPEAICNYLAIIGSSFEKEIMTLEELVQIIDFKHLHSVSAIKYDLEKLKWVNHQWIISKDAQKLALLVLPFLVKKYPQAAQLDQEKLTQLVHGVQGEMKTLEDITALLSFYFETPKVFPETLLAHTDHYNLDKIISTLHENINLVAQPEAFFTTIQNACKTNGVSPQIAWKIIRILLTGEAQGPGIKELLTMLGTQKSTERIRAFVR